MPNSFFISDTHFGHTGVCKFLRDDGTKLRPWDDPDEMDQAMIENWNKTVRPNDKVYHLGDVVINRKSLKTLALLNGDKVLIKGNHDIFKLNEYTEFFRDIRGYHVLNGMILSHIPIHEETCEKHEWDDQHGCQSHSQLFVRETGRNDQRVSTACIVCQDEGQQEEQEVRERRVQADRVVHDAAKDAWSDDRER